MILTISLPSVNRCTLTSAKATSRASASRWRDATTEERHAIGIGAEAMQASFGIMFNFDATDVDRLATRTAVSKYFTDEGVWELADAYLTLRKVSCAWFATTGDDPDYAPMASAASKAAAAAASAQR